MKKILWVDDDLTYSLRLFVDEFEDQAISVLRAPDASEGKKIFVKNQDEIDAVIIDIMMPPGEEFDNLETKAGFLSGLTLARFIKKINPQMPIIDVPVKSHTAILTV